MHAGRRLLALVVSSAVVVFILGWMYATHRTLQREAKEGFFRQYNVQQQLLAAQASRTIEEIFATFHQNLLVVASLFEPSAVTAARAQDVQASLRSIYHTLGDTPLIDLVVFDAVGDVVGIEPPDPYTLGRNYSWRGYFRWARDTGRPGQMYLSPFLRLEGGQNRGDMAVIVATGMYAPDGGFKGVVMCTLNFDQMAREHVLSLRIGEGGYAWLVDSNNETVLVDPNGRISSMGFREAFAEKWPGLYKLLVSTRDGLPGTGSYRFLDGNDPPRSVEKLVGYAPVRIEDRLWTLGVCTPVPEVAALMGPHLNRLETFSFTSIAVMVLGACLLLGLVLGWNSTLHSEVAVRTHDLEHATRQLQDTFEALSVARKTAAVGRLALGLAHEIRNPLSAIRVNMQYLQGKVPGDERTRESFDIVEGEILRLNNLLGEVLSFAKVSPVEPRPVDLVAEVRRVLTLLEPRLRGQAVAVRLESADEPLVAICDPGQVRQVFLNLVLNALDAVETVPAPRLTVRFSRQGDAAVVRIGDNGVGVPAEDLPNIFDPFFTTRASGFGLGLSITESIVVRNRGSVAVESMAGGGSTFSVSLPAAAPPDTGKETG
ncbi:MAG TPA: cache domain-containing protein [Deferrisomatales bacterium]|nr:cache domain-containing protein [Deferrisomatales bacterium]